MGRLEIIEKLRELEERKINFENLLKDMSSYYHKESFISVDISTQDYNRRYKDEKVKVTTDVFIGYLQEEINNLENDINNYIDKLNNK